MANPNMDVPKIVKIDVSITKKDAVEDDPLSCSVCKKKVACKYCQKLFTNNVGGIKRHESKCFQNPNQVVAEHICPKCGKGFFHKKDMIRHQNTSKKCINSDLSKI